MKNIILVDTENISLESYEGIGELKNTQTEIHFFISGYSKPIKPLLLFDLDQNDIKVIWEKIERPSNERNCMDFHIVAYMTLHATEHRNSEAVSYFIISKDRGYNEVSKYISKQLGVAISVISSLEEVVPTGEKSAELKPLTVAAVTESAELETPNCAQRSKYTERLEKRKSFHKPYVKNTTGSLSKGLTPIKTISSTAKPPVAINLSQTVEGCKSKASTKQEFHMALQAALKTTHTDAEIAEIYKRNKQDFVKRYGSKELTVLKA